MLMSGSCGKCCILTLFHQKSYSSIWNCQSTFQQRKTHTHTPLHKWLWLGLAVGLRKFNHLNLFSLFPWWKSSVRFQHEPVRAELLSAPLFMLIRYRHEMEESRVMRKSPEWIRRVLVCGRPPRPTGGGSERTFYYEFQLRTSSTCWKGCWDTLEYVSLCGQNLPSAEPKVWKPHRHYLLAAWPQISYLTSLKVGFLTWEMGLTGVTSLLDGFTD